MRREIEVTVLLEVDVAVCCRCRKEVPCGVERKVNTHNNYGYPELRPLGAPAGWMYFRLPGDGKSERFCGDCGPQVERTYAAVTRALGIKPERDDGGIVVWKCGVCQGGAHSGMECMMVGPPICEGCRADGKTAADVVAIQEGRPADGEDFVPAIVGHGG
jgi:hypothetical protein